MARMITHLLVVNGPFRRIACGKGSPYDTSLSTTQERDEVTCKQCRRTITYRQVAHDEGMQRRSRERMKMHAEAGTTGMARCSRNASLKVTREYHDVTCGNCKAQLPGHHADAR